MRSDSTKRRIAAASLTLATSFIPATVAAGLATPAVASVAATRTNSATDLPTRGLASGRLAKRATYSVMGVSRNGRARPTLSSGSMYYWGGGASVIMICWLDAERMDPPAARYSSPRWFVVQTALGNYRAWVHSSWVDRQTSVRQCRSVYPSFA